MTTRACSAVTRSRSASQSSFGRDTRSKSPSALVCSGPTSASLRRTSRTVVRSRRSLGTVTASRRGALHVGGLDPALALRLSSSCATARSTLGAYAAASSGCEPSTSRARRGAPRQGDATAPDRSRARPPSRGDQVRSAPPDLAGSSRHAVRWCVSVACRRDRYGAHVATVEEAGRIALALPDAFFTIPHFDGYAAVLIQLRAVTKRALREALVDGWLACAPAPIAKTFLERRQHRNRSR